MSGQRFSTPEEAVDAFRMHNRDHWTIICGVPSNIKVTPTSQRQLTLKDDNVHKNWTDSVGYCMASRGSHLN